MKRVTVLIGAVLAAIAASACCILPLLLGAASAGTVGFGAALAPYRPYLMGLTVMLLGAGFYFAYRPEKAANQANAGDQPDCCATDRAARMKRVNRTMLWAVAVFTLGAMAYPWIAAYRAGISAGSSPVAAAPSTAQTATFAIDKMTCAECATAISAALRKTPGVYDARVDFAARRAIVRYDRARITPSRLAKTITGTGFPATLLGPNRSAQNLEQHKEQ